MKNIHKNKIKLNNIVKIKIFLFNLNQPPNPYKVLPYLFSAKTQSIAVTVFLLACSQYVTASLTTFSKKFFKTYLESS